MKKVIFALTCSICLFAQHNVTSQETSVLEGGNKIGHVTVLTLVNVVKQNEKIATIKVRGWRNENYPQQIVKDMKRTEVYVEIKDEKKAKKLFKVINTKEDDYGEVWQEVEGTLQIEAKYLTQDKQSLYEKAQKTYTQNCSMCHRLHEPESFTVNQWPHQIETMMEQVALEKPTKNLIVKYLQQNAKDSK